MPCTVVRMPSGSCAIFKHTGSAQAGKSVTCPFCKNRTSNPVLCDFVVRPGATCDAVICRNCATHLNPNSDYCPIHAGKGKP